MVRNKLAMAVLALSVLQANVASALGLGNLSVKSALNQPLNAEIKLMDIGDLDASQIRIQLGSPDDFQRASVERDYFLTNLKFTVDLDGRGGGVVHISTREAVVEPYLNFVIEARWPNGRVLREFAVLLDPPTFNANRAAAPVAPAASGATARPTRPQRAPEPPTVTTEPAPAAAPATAGMALPAAEKGGEYRIQVYDTLSKIAAQHRPAADVSVEQTMLAIQRANPQVFIRNNVNLIKSGYVIRLPSADEARSLDAAQAASEVEQQVREWRGGTPRGGAAATAAASGPQLDARAPEPTDREGGYKEQARLSIAAPGGSDKSSAGEGSGGSASGKGVEALRNQLSASQESLEKGKRDNQELQSRLDDMERQIATLQKLISLKDDQLAALQTKSGQPDTAPAAAAPAATAAAPATPAEVPAAAAPAPTPVDGAAASTSTTTATTTTTTTTTPAPAPKPAPVKPAPAPVEEPTLLEQFTSNPMYLGGAGALALLIAGLVWQRRRKAAEERDDDDFVLDDSVDFTFDNTPDDAVRIDDAAASVVAESAAADRGADARANQAPPVRSETGDAIAEADIYIAYGRYQQAVDLLSHAIDAEPTRSDLRVKLLEVCLEMRNRDAFRQQFVALQGLGDGDAVAHAKDLLSSVDGVSDWLVDLPQSQRPVNELVASAAVAATAASAAIAAAEVQSNDQIDDSPAGEFIADEPTFTNEPTFSNETASAFTSPDIAADEPAADAGELDLDLDDLGLGDELPAGEELELEDEMGDLSFDKPLDFDKELGDLDLEDDLDLDGELDLDAPLDLADGLDLDKELDLEGGSDLGREVDLDRGLTSTASADELAEDLDLESHPGLDSEFDADGDLDTLSVSEPAPVPAPVDELGHFESELGADIETSSLEKKVDYDFEIDDIGDDLEAMPAGKTSFDLDSTSIELAGGPSPVATPEETTAVAAEPALDLGDDLGLALDEMGETGYLNDLESVADGLHELDQPTPAAAPADSTAFGDPGDEFDLGNLDAELPDIDRLDLAATTAMPDLQAEPAAELPDLAELPPEFDAAAAALDAESAPADADDEFDFLADADEIATKLDLARAYIDMGDTDGARDILDEVLQEGTDTQRQEASTLLDRIA